MTSAKAIRIEPIPSKRARAFVERHHYSGSTVQNSWLHLGAFLDGRLGGVMQFGSPLAKKKVIGLVRDTAWDGMVELNRMAFADWMPRNGESRSIAIAARIIRKAYPSIEWILSFADGTQCGDGTIYRASGFLLTQINPNKTLLELPSGEIVADVTMNVNRKRYPGGASAAKKAGAKPLPGFQLRYILPLYPGVRERLTCPILPFSKIEEAGATMFRGERGLSNGNSPALQAGEGGSTPTSALQPPAEA